MTDTKPLELQGVFGSTKKSGNWEVPASITLHRRMGSAELDFTQATFTTNTVTIDINMVGGSLEIRVPENASVDSDVVTKLGSYQDHRDGNPPSPDVRIHLRGTATWGSVETRGPRQGLFHRKS
ncbi:LiaF domain-containing protein [Luteipulveratus mongoliensis]|uniref:LiaF domain-containing protein n=1 Tax=Luteipulveratus mongoliensis TaxID=571913 RepID=UPI0006983D25|nr:LiaF domain-containing protein [Luteipulveratus mongoliensis]